MIAPYGDFWQAGHRDVHLPIDTDNVERRQSAIAPEIEKGIVQLMPVNQVILE